MNPISRKSILTIAALTAGFVAMQAQLPKLMVLPHKTWCDTKGYVDKIERNGKTRTTENYEEAFKDPTFTNVEMTLKDLFSEPGMEFPLTSYGEATQEDEDEDALDDAYESAQTGSGLQDNSFDALMAKKANAPDIYIKVGWSEDKVGLKKVINYYVDAVDSYSSKSVATVTGNSEPVAGTTPTGIVIKQGIKDKFAEFANKLTNHFQDLQNNGREIKLAIRIVDNGDGNTFNTEFGGKELSMIINDWIADNTVNHRFSMKNSTRNRLSFDQVRIPFKSPNGSQNNAKQWVDGLRQHIAAVTGIAAENNSRGLGAANLMLGEK